MIRFLTYLMFLPALAQSQGIIWSDSDHLIDVGNKLEILKDDSGVLTYDNVSSGAFEDKFKTSDNINLSLGYTEAFFWLRFTVNNISGSEAVLELAQAGIPQVDLYYQTDSSATKHMISGYQIPVMDKTIKSSFQVFTLPTGLTTYYIRINSNSEPIPVRIRSQDSYELSSVKHKFGYGIYLGLMLFVGLNSLFFFAALKNWMYLFYVFIVMLYISYSAAVIDGFIVYFLPNVDLIFLYTTIPTIGVTVQTLYCLFFLEAKKYVPKLYKIVLGIVIYFGLWAVIKFFFSFPIVQPINTLNALISFFVMGYVGVSVGLKGHKMGYYFALAYFIYFILVVMQALYINTGSPEYLGGLSHVAYATLIEAFILSFLLSKQTEWRKLAVEKEKREAQEKVIEAIKENERIIQQQNVRLEDEVEKRTEQLNDAILELHAANDNLKLSNEEKVAANDMLLEQKDRLEHQHEEMEKLIRTKDRFFSIISHDLRGPVSSFAGLSSLIKHNIEQKQYDQLETLINFMDRASSQLSSLLDNLLNWAVGHKGDFPYNPEEINVKFLIQEVKGTLQNMADSKKIKLFFDAGPELNIYADPNSVMTIFRNLVNNALKFTNKDGEVSLLASVHNDMAEIQVVDTGIGIPKDKMDALFEIKEKKSTWGTEGEKGLGLGIQLAYEFTTLNKGSIHVESEVNVGTTFTVRLPLAKTA